MYPLIRKLAEEGRLNELQSQIVEPRGAVELYDIKADPYEVHNLRGSPAHEEVRGRLRRRLRAWIDRTDDQGQKPDSAKVKEYFREYGRRSAKQRTERIKRLRRAVRNSDRQYLEWLAP